MLFFFFKYSYPSNQVEIELPKHRHMEFRQFFSFNKENFKNRFFIDVLFDLMSPDLQSMLAAHQHGSWIRKIPFFNARSVEERRVFISKVALCLDARAFSPGEVIYFEGDLANEMYIVQKGLAATKGYVISEGNFFGDDMVLPGARRGSSSRALTYLATYGLKYDDPEKENDDGEMEGGKGKKEDDVAFTANVYIYIYIQYCLLFYYLVHCLFVSLFVW